MTTITVDTAALTLSAFGRIVPCAIGKRGATPAAEKREGDGKTPRGRYPLRAVLVHPGRGAPPATALPRRWIREGDGWSDDAADPEYNRPVRHPHRFSAERMWRGDGLYDLVVVLGHNDSPPVPGMGSAIFLHCLADDGRATEGCVAIARDDLRALIESAAPGDIIDIV